MSADPARKALSLFEAALALEPNQRVTFLDSACADAPELRHKVEALLRLQAEGGDFLEGGAVGNGDRLLHALAEEGSLADQTGASSEPAELSADPSSARTPLRPGTKAGSIQERNWVSSAFNDRSGAEG